MPEGPLIVQKSSQDQCQWGLIIKESIMLPNLVLLVCMLICVPVFIYSFIYIYYGCMSQWRRPASLRSGLLKCYNNLLQLLPFFEWLFAM